jgi:glycosyltransferase involved in cell wall biosynthesis
LRRADRVLVFSDAQAQLVAHLHGVASDRVRVIPNGVRSEFFNEELHEGVHTPLRILSVGRLTVQKRVDRLIDAVGLLTEPAHLTIVGDGEDRVQLEALAHKSAPGRVTFVGKRTPSEVRIHYREADVFVLPSDKEGMPLTALEAMAAGLPVVGSNVLGIKELLEGAGVLVDEPSPETFRDALHTLMEDPARLSEVATRCRERVAAYDWRRITKQVLRVYTEVSL